MEQLSYTHKSIFPTAAFPVTDVCAALADVSRYLVHPNICQVYTYQPSTYSIDLYVERPQRSLWEEITLRDRYKVYWTDAELFWHLRTLVSALSFAEKCGYYHYALTPETIFVTDMELKVGDFSEAANPNRPVHQHPVFLSPETNQYQDYNGKSDVYSLGVVMLSMFALKVPNPELVAYYDTWMAYYPLLRNMVRCMLKWDARERVSFDDLETYFERIEVEYYNTTGIDVQATINDLRSSQYGSTRYPYQYPVLAPLPPTQYPPFSASLPAVPSASPLQYIPPPSQNQYYTVGPGATQPVYIPASLPAGSVRQPPRGCSYSRQETISRPGSLRTCVRCQTKFTPDRRFPNSAFCSKECFIREKREKYCSICGDCIASQAWVRNLPQHMNKLKQYSSQCCSPKCLKKYNTGGHRKRLFSQKASAAQDTTPTDSPKQSIRPANPVPSHVPPPRVVPANPVPPPVPPPRIVPANPVPPPVPPPRIVPANPVPPPVPPTLIAPVNPVPPPVPPPDPDQTEETSSGGFWSKLGAVIPRVAVQLVGSLAGNIPVVGPILKGIASFF